MGRRRIGSGGVLLILGLLCLFSCNNGLTTDIIREVSEAVNPKYPSIRISKDSSVFHNQGTVDLGQCDSGSSQQYIFSVSNSGTTDLVLPEVDRVVISPDTVFSIDSMPSTTIPAGGIRDFTLRFSPPDNTLYEAVLTISSNDPDLPEFSLTIQGEGVPPPETPAPTGLSASDGSSTAEVSLGWDPVGTADYYQVYRSTNDTTPDTPYDSFVVGTSFTDDSADPGIEYHYWVKAHSSLGLSDPSNPDTGYRRLSTASAVSATEGASTGYIGVSWASVTGADSYEIYRSTSTTAPSDDINIAELAYTGISGTSKNDNADHSTVVPGKKVYYWVRGRADDSDSSGAWKRSTSYGYKKLEAIDDLVKISSTFDYEVEISWTGIDGADSYYIYRAASPGVTIDNLHTPSADDDPNPTTNSSYFDEWDPESEPEEYKWYRVRPYASDTNSYGDLSNEVRGFLGYAGG